MAAAAAVAAANDAVGSTSGPEGKRQWEQAAESYGVHSFPPLFIFLSPQHHRTPMRLALLTLTWTMAGWASTYIAERAQSLT